jgi:hypothetical protein
MIIILNALSMQHPFKDCNKSRDNEPSSKGENNKRTRPPQPQATYKLGSAANIPT